MNNQAAWPFPTGNKPVVTNFAQTWPYPTADNVTITTTTSEMLPYASVQEVLVENKIRVAHFFNLDHPYGGVTVAYSKTSDFKNCKMVKVAVAYCSDLDPFSKKLGTSLALENYSNGNTILVPARLGGVDIYTVGMLRDIFWNSLFERVPTVEIYLNESAQ